MRASCHDVGSRSRKGVRRSPQLRRHTEGMTKFPCGERVKERAWAAPRRGGRLGPNLGQAPGVAVAGGLGGQLGIFPLSHHVLQLPQIGVADASEQALALPPASPRSATSLATSAVISPDVGARCEDGFCDAIECGSGGQQSQRHAMKPLGFDVWW